MLDPSLRIWLSQNGIQEEELEPVLKSWLERDYISRTVTVSLILEGKISIFLDQHEFIASSVAEKRIENCLRVDFDLREARDPLISGYHRSDNKT